MNNHEHAIPNYQLTQNYSISRILKGGWQLAGGHGTIDSQTAINDMFAFTEKGITTFDCADIYTGVEELIGEFLLQYRQKYGKEKTDEIKIHTKFVPDLNTLNTLKEKDVEKIIDRSLSRLHLEHLPLVQFHWWDYDIPRYVETAILLKDLQKKGKILHLAGTNFDVPHLKEIIDGGVKLISLQIQYSLLDHRPEHEMKQYCQKQDIKLICYGTVAGGFLSKRYLGKTEPETPLENRSLTKYKLIIDDVGGWDYFQSLLETLNKIAQKHNVSITNIATKYILDKPNVAGIVIGVRNTQSLKDNIKLFDFELDTQDKKTLQKIISQAKGPTGDIYSLERIKNGRHASIMKYNLNEE